MPLRGVAKGDSSFVVRQRLRVLALAFFVWTPSVAQGQQESEVTCTEYEARSDSTPGGVRMRTRTSPVGAGFLGLSTVRNSGSEDNPSGYPRVGRVYCGYPAYEAGLGLAI